MRSLLAWRPMQAWRLSSRMVLLSLLLLLLVQAMGFVVIRTGLERNARATLAEELRVAERVWTRLLAQRAAQLGQGAALLAADHSFCLAVASNDQAAIISALENHGARTNATMVALLDTGFALRAHAPALQPSLAQPVSTGLRLAPAPALWPALATLGPQLAQQGSLVSVVGGRPQQWVMVPLRAPVLVGWVLMGFEIDRSLVSDLQAVAGLDASLVLRTANAPARLLHSSLLPGQQPLLLAQQPLPLGQRDVQLGGTHHLAHTLPVSAATGSEVLVVTLTGSLAQALAPFQSLQWTLAALTLVGLALFGVASLWVGRRVTQPLRRLVRASEQLGRGDYDTPLDHTGRADEIGDLAKAFEHMRQNIGQQQRQIRQLAYWDRLTGLPNRLQFRDTVQAATLRGEPMAVVMLDLDRFKHVNDVLGYAFGDQLLQCVAQRLRGAVRAGDLVARLGGDEFAMLLPMADAAKAQALVQRISTAFETPLVLDDHRVDLSAALGIAVCPDHATEADALISRAEVAMYAAKRHSDGAQLYEPALDHSSAQTLSLLSELRHAVENNELRLFLQPKVLLADGSLCGAEALVRWQHPERGLVPPLQFIPFAEQTGYVRQLTLWVFGEAARQQAALRALGVRRLSINLSTRDLLDSELPDKLETLLTRHNASAEAFCLEITESAIMDDPQRAEATLNRLSQRGYQLSIDDFGTGYSSLAYLKRLPVHELKIDQSFVKGMDCKGGADSEGDIKIVRSTIDLAHNLGLTVVAEGVETAAILQQLAEMGCDEAQGYHMGKPMPLVDLQLWALRWKAARTAAAAAPVPAAQIKDPENVPAAPVQHTMPA